MGEVHVNMTITLDGVIQANGGPNEQDGDYAYAGWEGPYWGDEAAGAQMVADVQGADALLFGRTTYDIFRGYWPGKTDEFGRAFDRVPKYVASRGTPELSWADSHHLTDVGPQVSDLRERHRQIHVWGSGNLLQTLFQEGLVDQINLWVCPIVLGEGKKLFPEGTTPTRFEQSQPPRGFATGLVLMRLRHLEGAPVTGIVSEPVPAAD